MSMLNFNLKYDEPKRESWPRIICGGFALVGFVILGIIIWGLN